MTANSKSEAVKPVNTTKSSLAKPSDAKATTVATDASEVELWQQVQQTYPEANFLQSPTWAKTNRLIGHKVIIQTTTQPLGWCLMIIKNAKRGRYLEIPGGPLIDWQDATAVEQTFAQIRQLAQQEKCVFVRFRPQLRRDVAHGQLLANLGCQPAPMHLHAEHTIMLDLTKPSATLLSEMRRQTRYEVRRAVKLGIKVESGRSADLLEEFYQAQAETAARQHFVPPSWETLSAEREAFADNFQIYVAKTADGQPIAYGLFLLNGAEAEYFEAASTDLHRKLPGAYALLWQAMQDFQQRGVKRLNLWGIAPAGQKHHRYAGVTTFKTGFGGEIVEFIPAQDIIIRRISYLFDLIIERFRKKIRHL